MAEPTPGHLGVFARKQKLDGGSRVNVMLPAGSNSRFTAELATAVMTRLHGEHRDAALKLIARVDVGDTPAAGNVKEATAEELDELVAALNADPESHSDTTMEGKPWLQQLEVICEELHQELVLLIQRQSNSRVEAERAVNPPEQEREIVGEPTHVVQLSHVGNLARRQRMGIEDGFRKPGALPVPRRNVSVLTSNTVRPPASGVRENPLETLSLLAALAENMGVPLSQMRRYASVIKGMLSK